MKTIDVIIADDHPIFREGLRQILQTGKRIRILHAAGDGNEALERAREDRPDVVIVDVSMPMMGGLEVAAERRRENLSFELILLTMHNDKETFDRALNLGVKGYVLKDDASEDIIRCVEAVTEGKVYVSSGVAHLLLGSRRTESSGGDAPHESDPGPKVFTPAERRILRLIAQDKTSKEIADELGISPKTVDNHRSNMCTKLGLFGSHSLMRFAMERRDEL